MGEVSKIEWTDATFNPWIGCTKVSAACDNCYAEAWDKRHGGARWGAKAERKRTKTWGDPRKWQRQADAFEAEHGRRRRVFCASLADVFDNQVPPEWRCDLWDLIRECDRLDWLLLTKRPQNIAKMLPPDWGDGWPHVWLGTTAENQTEADRRIPHLLATPAAVRFVSAEPLLGSIDFARLRRFNAAGAPWIDALHGLVTRGDYLARSPDECSMNVSTTIPGELPALDWIIVGGESGPSARPMHPDWARSIRDQCAAAGTAFLFKQWGEWVSAGEIGFHGHEHRPRFDMPPASMMRVGKHRAGRALDGQEHNGFPAGRAALSHSTTGQEG
jgi:protein gp37